MAETSGRGQGRGESSRRLDPGLTQQDRGAQGAAEGGTATGPGRASRSRAPSAPAQRPWVGARFVRGLLIALPLAIGLWALIAWAVAQLF